MDARRATLEDAHDVARLLDDFNTEFDTPTPATDALTARLRTLLATDETFAIVTGTPPVAVALVTLRPNVWYEGPVALLDEMYVAPDRRGQGLGTAMIDLLLATCRARGVELVEINVDQGDVDARRFYERAGFSATEPTTGESALYYFQELAP